MTSQPISPAIVVMLTNQPKTTDELLPKLRYTNGMNMSEAATAIYGVPNLLVRSSIWGACLSSARPYKVREARNTQAEPQLKADVHTTALIIDGRTLMPTRWKAITKGLCCASPVDMPRFESLYGTSIPTIQMLAT